MVIQKIRVKPTRPQFDILQSTKQVNLFLGGQGSGKTFGAGVKTGILISTYPKLHGFIGANTYTQLSDSTLFRIREVWKTDFSWTEYSKYNPAGVYVVDKQPPDHFNTDGHNYDTYHGKICFAWGTVVYKGSLDNYKAHDGKEFAWAILDETKDTKEAAVKEVILGRLREPGMTTPDGKDWNPLFIFTSPAKVQWINEWFKLDEHTSEITSLIYSKETYFKMALGNKLAVISSTYHNEKNLPASYIENQKANLHSALQDMLIYGNPFSQSGGEFYKCFNRTKHVINNPNRTGFPSLYLPALPLHISFDFNVNPYMTCTIWQIRLFGKDTPEYVNGHHKQAIQIDEICLKNPLNTSPAICKEFIRRYQSHAAGLFIYGDPAGDHEDTRVDKRTEKKYNDFTIILNELQQFRPSLRTERSAPPVVMRGNFINTIFEKNFDGIQILIGDNCKNSINDYTYLKEASDGRKLKEKVADDQTGVSYEKFGHTSDSADYILCSIFGGEFSLYQRGRSSPLLVTGKPEVKNKWE